MLLTFLLPFADLEMYVYHRLVYLYDTGKWKFPTYTLVETSYQNLSGFRSGLSIGTVLLSMTDVLKAARAAATAFC